jgi:hypothetical protein
MPSDFSRTLDRIKVPSKEQGELIVIVGARKRIL